MIASMHMLFCVLCMMTRPCPWLLPTFKAWLLSTRLFCFSNKLYVVFRSDDLEKSGQKSILSWRCHKFNWKRRYENWNFAFFRLDKCQRWQQLLCRCFKTLIGSPCLLIANTTLLAFQTLFLFFSKSALPNWECSLSTDAAYTWTFTVFGRHNCKSRIFERMENFQNDCCGFGPKKLSTTHIQGSWES